MPVQAATEAEREAISLPLILQPEIRDLVRSARLGIWVFLLMLALPVTLIALNGVNAFLLGVFLLFWLPGMATFLLQVNLMRHKSGRWNIRLDEAGLHWQSPDPEVDHSFFLPLEKIDCVGTELTSGARNNGHFQKVIVLSNGHRLHLSNRPEINLHSLYIALEKLGKPFRLTHLDDDPLPITCDLLPCFPGTVFSDSTPGNQAFLKD